MNNFSPRAQQVLALARKEAERLGSAQVRPEHLLLGVFLLPHSNAMRMLENLSIKLESMRTEVEKAASNQTPNLVSAGAPAFSDAYDNSLNLAQTEAQRMGHRFLGSEHILLGVLHQGNGAPAQIFRKHGVYLDSLRNTLLELFDPGASARTKEVWDRIYLHDLHEQRRVAYAKAAARKGPALWGLIRYINWNLVGRL